MLKYYNTRPKNAGQGGDTCILRSYCEKYFNSEAVRPREGLLSALAIGHVDNVLAKAFILFVERHFAGSVHVVETYYAAVLSTCCRADYGAQNEALLDEVGSF